MKNFIISQFLAKKANNRTTRPSLLKRLILAAAIRNKLNKRDAMRKNRR